jgi:isopropylmalate/homocitrate/citramalate synthase
MKMPAKVLINDVTLREGEQAADVDFSMKDKIEIVKKLAELGVQQVQCGYPGRSKIDWETIKTIKAEKIPIQTEAIAQVFQKDWKEQIDICISCQPDSLDLMYPSSPLRLKYVQKATEEEMLKISVEAVKYAVNRGVLIRFAPTDSARTRLPFLLEVYERVIEAGAERITLTDTAGNLTPTSTRYLVGEITKKFRVPLQIHCHNDYGLATANTLAAFEAGASILDASINGYGERSGNTALDELVVALRVFYGVDLGIRLELLTGLSQYLENLSGVPLPPMKPIVGKYAFAHKLDAHVMGVLQNPIVYETMDPSVVGNVRRIPLGKYSGPFAIRKNAERLGVSVPDDQLEAVRQEVINFAVQNRASLTDEVFQDILKRNVK